MRKYPANHDDAHLCNVAVVTVTHHHPDLQRVARYLPKVGLRAATLPAVRWASRLQRRHVPRDVQLLTTTEGVQVRLHRPPNPSGTGAAMLWIHGGGYLIGTAAQDDLLCRQVARRLGITVANVEYGLAPRHQHPTPVEHCYSALTWLSTLPAVNPDRIVVAGASAGGGLAAQLAFLARDRGEVQLAGQQLVYPMLDDRTRGSHPGFRLWDGHSNELGWEHYLGPLDDGARDRVVPGRRTDLAGLPPTWIGVGTVDLFHDEDLDFARRLTDAGVPSHLEVVPGAFHGFDRIAMRTPLSRSFFDAQCDWLRTELAFG